MSIIAPGEVLGSESGNANNKSITFILITLLLGWADLAAFGSTATGPGGYSLVVVADCVKWLLNNLAMK